MDLLTYLSALRRWWWVLLGLPLIVLLGELTLGPAAPFTTELRATVLIPGDTEDTGSAERPELMVLDDLSPLIGSDVFAEAILEQMTANGAAPSMELAEVKSSLTGSRYSRVVTVTVTNSDAADARALAEAAVAVLPNAVNSYLVAPGSQPATVQIIDRPDEPAPATRARWLRIAVSTMAALFAACAIIAVVTALPATRVRSQRAAPTSK